MGSCMLIPPRSTPPYRPQESRWQLAELPIWPPRGYHLDPCGLIASDLSKL